MERSDIGMIGLSVMGSSLALNLESKGYAVSAYSKDGKEADAFCSQKAKGKRIVCCRSLPQLVASLKTPRKIMMMVRAGAPVDQVLSQIKPLLESGDIIIDGGNSNYLDTERRATEAEEEGFLYLGVGISGGEDGARNGPSIMAGGSAVAWQYVQPVFRSIAAKKDGEPCCGFMGSGGAGHYVKMTHNGIEYGDMQLIGEAYHLMKHYLGLSTDEIRSVFQQWNAGESGGFLIEITAMLLAYLDDDGLPLVEKILDVTEQKGTGKWAVNSSLEEGVPLTLIGEAVSARFLSALKAERTAAAKNLSGPNKKFRGEKEAFVRKIKDALDAAKLVCYAQGFALLKAAAKTQAWPLPYEKIALIWRNGCIIRSNLLDKIGDAYQDDPDLPNLLLSPYFKTRLARMQTGWRETVASAVQAGVPVPAMSAALSYYDAYRSETLPANLLQAQRDFFGAHTYLRTDREGSFHTDWKSGRIPRND